MRSMSRGAGILVALATLALPLAAGDCGRTACITVTQADLENGACPAPAAARARFSSPACPGPVTAVDGPGVRDGSLCCYPVEIDDADAQPCGTGNGGAPPVGSSSVSGTGGLPAGCVTCGDALRGAPFTKTCGNEQTLLQDLEACGCSGACLTSCDPSLCIGNAPDTGCLDCLLASCGPELQSCQQG